MDSTWWRASAPGGTSLPPATSRGNSSYRSRNLLDTAAIPSATPSAALDTSSASNMTALVPAGNACPEGETTVPKIEIRPRPEHGFQPMDAVLNLPLKQLEDKHRQSIADEDAFRAEKKINPAYLGNIYHSANHGANIPEELNCSLFIYNLPAHMTEKSLIEALLPHAPFDRIYALSVTPPSAGSFSDTSIAKITTFTRAGAEKLYNFIHAGWLAISGQQTRVRWNQIKVAAFPGDEYLSRVLLISGPKDVVTIPNLTAHLSRGIAYQLEAATVKQETADIRLIEWRFCSFRAQASSAKLLLRWELPAVTTRFGVDPLAVPLRAVPAGPRRFPPWDRSTEWV